MPPLQLLRGRVTPRDRRPCLCSAFTCWNCRLIKVRYLFDPSILSFLRGQMTHKRKIFEYISLPICFEGTLDSRVVAKFGEVNELSSRFANKNPGCLGLVQAPILPPLGRSHQKFPERYRPWAIHVSVCLPNLVRICCGFMHLFPQRFFFGPPKSLQC